MTPTENDRLANNAVWPPLKMFKYTIGTLGIFPFPRNMFVGLIYLYLGENVFYLYLPAAHAYEMMLYLANSIFGRYLALDQTARNN